MALLLSFKTDEIFRCSCFRIIPFVLFLCKHEVLDLFFAHFISFGVVNHTISFYSSQEGGIVVSLYLFVLLYLFSSYCSKSA